jgi:hypothetical protein
MKSTTSGWLRSRKEAEIFSLDSFKGQSGLLTGPYPNPYRLILGEEFPKEKDFSKLLHLPLLRGKGGEGLPVMWIYQGPNL